jgi:SAM-dependent methyltransferase
VTETQEAVDELVARVYAAAAKPDSHVSRARALERILDDLGVHIDDPAWTDGRDVIGAAYERLVPGSARRALGQFFTPMWIGRLMSRWLLEDDPKFLFDPGCGSGALLAAAAQERAGATRLVGIDVDKRAIAMARANATVRRIGNLELRQGDFLRDDPSERPAAIVCNPPYTRHHDLTAAAKRDIHERFAKRLDVRFSQLASLHVLFLVRALEVAAGSARLAFLTPAHWLDMSYAKAVKTLLLDKAHVETVVSFPSDELVFDHALTTAAITFIRKGVDGALPTRVVTLKRGTPEEVAAALADPEIGTTVKLKSGLKWSRPRAASSGVRLDALANVRRGLATGCNSFFVLSDKRRRELALNNSYLLPCAATPRLFPSDEIGDLELEALPENAPRWLLNASRRFRRGPLADYLAEGENDGVPDRHLAMQRERTGRPWFRLELVTAPILFSYFNRRRARFVRNRAGAIPLNNWLLVTPKPGVDADALFAILSQPIDSRLKENRRVYGNGLWKLEPSELRALRLPPMADKLRPRP